ncbi:MAG: FHA domain-containing protein [Polyangiaceae bacterium]|nr:FHA domain-containing protein [Polyangiaceae bacterium]
MPVALVARVVDTQTNQSFEVTFERFPVRIGRNQLNDLHIDRPYVSQFHAAIDLRDRQIIVRDLGSTNGTVFAGQRLQRDVPVDVTQTPEITIGPVTMRFSLSEAAKREERREGFLDMSGEAWAAQGAGARKQAIAPGQEDPYLRQLMPYLEAYRAAWGTVYRILYDHLARLQPEVRQAYLRRLASEQAAVSAEPDFQKLAQYYGVDAGAIGEMTPPKAAQTALAELHRTLAPDTKPLDDVSSILQFARRLRDSMEVFLKCFISLRDGYQAFTEQMLGTDGKDQNDRVAVAKDAKELGLVLLTPAGGPDAARQLNENFIEVMAHEVKLLNGVMEGVKTLLGRLSPKTMEDELERKGKKGGLFSSKYEELWKLYESRHGDYAGEDKQTFEAIFGPQFARAYAASAGEDYKGTSGESGQKPRFTISANQMKR